MITFDEYIKNNTDNEIYIKIINCSSELYWYKNIIGTIFKVLKLCGEGYIVKMISEYEGYYIEYNDSEIIMPTLKDVIEYKLEIEQNYLYNNDCI